MTAQHTPWQVHPFNSNLVVVDEYTILHAYTPERAAFIVRAVNSHERLLEATEALLPFTPNKNGWSTPDSSEWVQQFKEAADELRAAIAAARGTA